MAVLMLALGISGLSGGLVPGDLAVLDCDIRTVDSEPWMLSTTVLYRAEEFFIGVLDPADGTVPASATVIAEGPVDLDRLRIGRFRPAEGLPAGIPGEIVFSRGGIFLVELDKPSAEPLLVPGIGFLGRLHPYVRGRTPVPPPAQGSADGYVADMVAAVSQDSILTVIQHFEDYGTRYMFSPQYDACADWVDTWMSVHWIPCELQPFEYGGDSMSNVVAEIPGVEDPEIIYVVCGHLDSYSEVSPEVTAPGADDDGSGCAGVLEAARVMCPYSFRYTLRFVCFAAEEAWMVGSYNYVEQAAAAGDDIRGAINLDMILYAPDSPDTLYMAFDDQSSALGQMAAVVMSTYVPQLPALVEYNPGEAGDHCSFWEFGYPAIVSAEASADEIWGGYNPHYHQPSDILANYVPSFPYGTDAVRGAVAIAATLAGPVGPSSSGEGDAPAVALTIGPNPSSGQVSVILEGIGAQVPYRIFDVAGRCMMEGEVQPSTQSSIDLRSLPSGIYVFAAGYPGIAPKRLALIR
jgi:leucyl aminopeptidase